MTAAIEPSSIYVTKRLHMEDIVEGAQFLVVRKISVFRILSTIASTGDYNRIHWDPFFARRMGFPTVVAHGQMISGFLSGATARLFKHGCTVREVKNLKFSKPLCIWDQAHCLLTIEKVQKRGDLNRVEVGFTVTNGGSELALTGSCLVYL